MTADEKAQMDSEIEERAAIREYDGGETRRDAERNARIEVIGQWQERKRNEKKV